MTVIHFKTYKHIRDNPDSREKGCEQVGKERPELIADGIERYIDSLDWNEYKEVLDLVQKRYFESPFGEGELD